MRAKPPNSVIESRIAKRYHRLHQPIIELVQALQDAIPQGMELGERVELTQVDGYINIDTKARPVELVLNDGQQIFSLKIKQIRRK